MTSEVCYIYNNGLLFGNKKMTYITATQMNLENLMLCEKS